MEDLKKGDLVLNTNKHSNVKSKHAIFLNYGLNASYAKQKSLSKVLIDGMIVQIPTAFLTKSLEEE